ncbi:MULTISPECIES: MarR family transcriptional regulator [Amycolatopsis]|uniref:MarR family transcriptional regulator n=1 Tax=Amycolatopsis TaxID=1813 RepID=UPI000B8AA252|nr:MULTISPECIES: MarR family transcriptional regulator [Amycolatopsis]OXM62269.1 MarR family transcriptional regulator [Amycolatopsis sp. KNN50.9b]
MTAAEAGEVVALSRRVESALADWHARVARQAGLSPTEYRCLRLIVRAGRPLTAGQLAQRAALSTGAVTGVLDRLERAGQVRRTGDPADRRKVLVEPVGATAGPVRDWCAVRSGLASLAEGCGDRELSAIRRYLSGWLDLLS